MKRIRSVMPPILAGALLATVAAHSLAASPPAVLGGLAATITTESWDEEETTYRYGPYLDIDYRAPVAENAYWGAWYLGRVEYDTDYEDFIDANTLGLRYGGSLRDDSYLLRASVAVSSDLGDDTSTIDPDWSAAYTRAFNDRWNGTLRYSGLSRYQEDATDDRVSHGADLEIAYDPSLRIGLRTGPVGSVTMYRDWTVLDDDGTESNAIRRDLAAEYRIGAEGLLGFFTLWTLDLAGGIIQSTANRLIDGEVEASEDRTTGRLDVSLTSRPARVLSLSATATADAAWYSDRTALDADGVSTDEATYELWTVGTIDTSWRLSERWSFIVAADGGRLISNDKLLDGWTASASIAVEGRLY